MSFGFQPPAWHALPPRQVAPAWHPAPQQMVIRPRYVPVAPRSVFTRYSTPNYAPAPAPTWNNQREFQRRHDEAFRLVEERRRNAARYSASQANSAAAQAAQAQLLQAQQQLAALQAQQAAAAAAPGAVVTAPAPSPVVMQPSMPSPQPDVSPGNATQDMGPTQDAAAAAGGGPGPGAGPGDMQPGGGEHPGHAMGRKIIFGLVIVGLGVGGYMFVKKSSKKSGGSPSSKSHAPSMHGFRRRGRRRR